MRHPKSGFAGVAFEGEGLSVYWKGTLTPAMEVALTLARRTGPVAVKAAPFSAMDLQTESQKIDKVAALHGATDIQTIGFAPDGTALHITRQPDSARKAVAAARLKSGKQPVTHAEQVVAEAGVRVPVTFETAAASLVPDGSRATDSPPWNGGGWWHNVSKNTNCTTGFGVHSYGHSYVLTAAHCASSGDYLTNAGRYMGPVYADDWSYDIMLIDAPGWHVIYDGSPTTTTTKNVNSWGYWAANELVCQSGQSSGTVCNLKQVESVNGSFGSDHPDSDGDWGYTIYGVIKTVQIDGRPASRSGDSGGPVFTLDGAGVRAKGITSSSGAQGVFYFQDWATILTRLAALPNINSTTS